MILRPRQALLVQRTLAALGEHGNTLAVAPTGSGKTVMLSAVAGSLLAEPDAKACILAHRTELTGQNRSKFERVNPGLKTSVFDANEKSWDGNATFAMVQTLSRGANLEQMPTLDLLIIDEAHHAVSPSYREVIDQVLVKNPKAAICGLTATPNRGDGKGLREVFSNLADQITLGEMIASGHLVPPRTYVIDVGTQDALRKVRRTATDFDMNEVASILNKTLITESVITNWKAKASDRKTIVFCSTVEHASDVCKAFNQAGVHAVLIHGELSDAERKERLASYETGRAQVVVNVAVLTEGYDYTPTSCVVLLRPSSYKSTFIQMVGRGLRTVDPQEFPGVVKTDCIVLDFGTASLMHGALEQEVNLNGHDHDGDAPTKDCPECGAVVPLAVMECPFCSHVWEPSEASDGGVLDKFVMSEIDLLSRSNFRWCDLFGSDDALMATGFTAWGGIFFLNGRWHAIGGGKGLNTRLLAVGERTVCMASLRSYYSSSLMLHRPDESTTVRQLIFELRNGPGLPIRYVDKIDNQWEIVNASERLVLKEYGQRLDAERLRKLDVILQILLDEGFKGNCYTANQFAEAFEGKAGLGGERTIRERLSALATQGYIKYFRNAQDYGLPSIGRSKFGYLCVEGMVVNLPQGEPDLDTGEVHTVSLRVLPTHYKCPLSGAAMPVENPEVWVYPENSNDPQESE